MAKTINLRKLNAIFNEYLKSREEVFADFLVRYGYATINAQTNDFNFTDRAASMPDANLDFDLEKSTKYAYYLSFLAWKKQEVLASNQYTSANALARTIVDQFLVNNKSLGLDDKSAKFVMDRLAIGQEKVKTEKSHPKLRWFLKKILVPAAIGLAVGVGVGLGFALAGLAIGTLPFVSESLVLTLGSYTLIGGVATAVATPIVINIKDAIVKAYHKRKLNGKDTIAALNENLDSDEFSVDDLESLPVKNFLDKFLAKEAKAIDRRENSRRKHVRKAGTRNKLHAIIDFTKTLQEQLKKGNSLLQDSNSTDKAILKYLYPSRKERKAVAHDPDTTSEVLKTRLQNAISRRKSVLTYINSEIEGDIIENFIAYKQGKDKKFRMADIFVRHAQGVKKNSDVAVVEQVVKPIYMSVLTSGFGSAEDAGRGTKKNLLNLANERQQKVDAKEKTKKDKTAKQNTKKKKTENLEKKDAKKQTANKHNKKENKEYTRTRDVNVQELAGGKDNNPPIFVQRMQAEQDARQAQEKNIKKLTKYFEGKTLEELRTYYLSFAKTFQQGLLTQEQYVAWNIATDVLNKAEFRSKLEQLTIEQLYEFKRTTSDDASKAGWTKEYVERLGIISDVIKEKEAAAAAEEAKRKAAAEEEAANKAAEARKAQEDAARAKAEFRSELEKLTLERIIRYREHISYISKEENNTEKASKYVEYLSIIAEVIKEKEAAAAAEAEKAREKKPELVGPATQTRKDLANARRQRTILNKKLNKLTGEYHDADVSLTAAQTTTAEKEKASLIQKLTEQKDTLSAQIAKVRAELTAREKQIEDLEKIDEAERAAATNEEQGAEQGPENTL